MKKTLLLALALVLGNTIEAQTSQQTERIYIGNGVYGSKDVKMKQTSSCGCTIDDALAAGNTSYSNDMYFQNGSFPVYNSLAFSATYGSVNGSDGSHSFVLQGDGFLFYNGSSLQGGITAGGGIPTLLLKDHTSSNNLLFIAGALTANRTLASPDHSGIAMTNDYGSVSSGITSQDHITFSHGLSYTPTYAFAIPLDASTGNAFIGWFFQSATSTTITFGFQDNKTGTMNFKWVAQ